MSIKNTVLIIGTTSGIGAGLARRIHAQGKKVIATGRRQERLTALAAERHGLETSCFDFSDIDSLPSNITDLTKRFPQIDTVIVCAAMQGFFNLTDQTSSAPSSIEKEVTTNLTAPIVLCQILVPFFLESKRPCSIIFISSAFAYVPIQHFPVYCPTKAALHSFGVVLRAQLSGTNVTVTDVAPPYVDTELDKDFRDRLIAALGGPEKALRPTLLDEFLDTTMTELDAVEDGKPKKEIAIGPFPDMMQKAWRNAFDPALKMLHVDG